MVNLDPNRQQNPGEEERTPGDFRQPQDLRDMKEKVADPSIERGVAEDQSIRKRAGMGKMIFLGLGLIAVTFLIIGLMNFQGFKRKPKQELDKAEVENIAPKDFNKDKADIPLPMPEIALPAAASEVATMPPAATTAAPPPSGEPVISETMSRRLGGEVIVAEGSDSRNAADNGAITPTANTAPADGYTADYSGGDGSFVFSSKTPTLADRLAATTFPATRAGIRADRTFLLSRGTMMPCVLVTKIVTTYPGLTKCQVTKDVYSADGKVLLVERGSMLLGEQQSALVQGQARVFALWTQIETPKGVVVNIDSPGSDTLGGSGHPAYVDTHFWKRFGGAIMLSLINDVSASVAKRLEKNNGAEITLNNTNDAARELAAEALKNSINIPPTGYVNQGTQLNVFVARDVDFSQIYELITRQAAFDMQ